MSVQMASSSTSSLRSPFKWQKDLPAKYVVNPVLLSDELMKLFGRGQFIVEMRHNAYKIKASQDFSIQDLVKQFRSLRRTASTRSTQLSVGAPVEA